MQFQFDDGGRKNAGFRGKADDCVVRAIAIATELPYREVYEELQGDMDYLRDFGRKSKFRTRLRTDKAFRRSSVRDGVYKQVFRPYLEDLGWTNATPCSQNVTRSEMRCNKSMTVVLSAKQNESPRLPLGIRRHNETDKRTSRDG